MSADFFFVSKCQQICFLSANVSKLDSRQQTSEDVSITVAFVVGKLVFVIICQKMSADSIFVRKVRPMHVPAVPLRAVEFARQPCSDLHDARILAIVMIHPSRQGCCIVSKFFLTVSKISKQIMPVSKFCKQIFSVSKFDFRKQFFFAVSKLYLRL